MRVVDEAGAVVIMDTPIYRRRASGEKMVAERKATLLARYSFESNALESENFLTYPQVRDLGDSLGIHWLYFRPFYGLLWFLRSLRAMLSGKREPAKFHVIVGTKKLCKRLR